MRKLHDMRPALSGFYHEPIFAKSQAANQAWADLRATKASR